MNNFLFAQRKPPLGTIKVIYPKYYQQITKELRNFFPLTRVTLCRILWPSKLQGVGFTHV